MVQNSNIDAAIRKLRNWSGKEGLIKELHHRVFFESRLQRRRRKIRENARLRRKREQRVYKTSAHAN